MKPENIEKVNEAINLSVNICNYLFDYLHDKIEELIDDYEISEENAEEIRIIGYRKTGFNELTVYVEFFDECSESGIDLEEYIVDINEFNDWLNN